MEALRDRKKVIFPEETDSLFRNSLTESGFEVEISQSRSMLFFHFPDPLKTGINEQLLFNLNKGSGKIFSSERMDRKIWIAVSDENVRTFFTDARHLVRLVREELNKKISKGIKFYSFR